MSGIVCARESMQYAHSYSARTLHEHIACKYSTLAHKKQSITVDYSHSREHIRAPPRKYAMSTARR